MPPLLGSLGLSGVGGKNIDSQVPLEQTLQGCGPGICDFEQLPKQFLCVPKVNPGLRQADLLPGSGPACVSRLCKDARENGRQSSLFHKEARSPHLTF